MSAAERITELIKAMHEREREQAEAWATLDKYTGRYDGAKWQREALYDRAVLR